MRKVQIWNFLSREIGVDMQTIGQEIKSADLTENAAYLIMSPNLTLEGFRKSKNERFFFPFIIYTVITFGS